jgi:hypothetical protein
MKVAGSLPSEGRNRDRARPGRGLNPNQINDYSEPNPLDHAL